jgi:hypothetical protein
VGGARENGALEEKSRDGQGSSKARGREGGRRCSLAHRRRRRRLDDRRRQWTIFLYCGCLVRSFVVFPPLDPQIAEYESGIRSLFVDVVDEDGRHRIATL